MTTDETMDVLNVINERLCLAASVTFKGDEVKCWTASADGPDVDKTYLSAADCQALADAFGLLALHLGAAQRQGKEPK